ncbi:MAG: glutamate dehydrogenase [Latescibacteria bacterium DG_63]|nr:MAG: glutamate dehydrogenase [Latescibacteria bacterium DG_63]
MNERLNPFEIAQTQLDKVAKLLKLEPAIHAMLRQPMRELHVSLPVRMDDGSVRVFRGFRVQYNDARGPCKGGIRFHPNETIDTVRALAAWMTWKAALANLPFGGGKGGVTCNPKKMSDTELERLARAYILEVGRMLGPERDIAAPDVYTNPQVMAWMADEYSRQRGYFVPAVVTGKPVSIGGSLGREDATARGSVYAVREACQHTGLDPEKCTIAVQGFGNVGSFAAILAREVLGCRVVAVSDSLGGIHNPKGLDPREILEHKEETGSVANFPGTKPITNEELLELNVDILWPSAIENVITRDNAERVKAKIVAEGANGPTSPDADEILFKKGAFVVPDFMCNSGGVIVSYFEWLQNMTGDQWSETEVHRRLQDRITRAFHDTIGMASRHNVDNRTAAYIVAVSRVAEVMKVRGWLYSYMCPGAEAKE